MGHEQDTPSVDKLIKISVIGTLVAILVAFLGSAALNSYQNKLPDEYQKSSLNEK